MIPGSSRSLRGIYGGKIRAFCPEIKPFPENSVFPEKSFPEKRGGEVGAFSPAAADSPHKIPDKEKEKQKEQGRELEFSIRSVIIPG